MPPKDVPSAFHMVSRSTPWRRWSAQRVITLTSATGAVLPTVGLVAFWGLRPRERADAAVEHTRDVLEASHQEDEHV